MQKRRSKKVESLSLLTGSLIAAILAASPYFFYLYEGFPDVKVWETSFFGLNIRYDSQHYQSIYVVAWTLTGKVIPLVLLLIWFFTCKHWWYHAILIPIVMLGLQIYYTLNDDLSFVDSNEIFILAPLILVMLIFSYGIRMKIFDRIHNIDLSELERVTIKGELKEEEENQNIYSNSFDEDDDEPLFMG
ncbi:MULTISPECIES: hypothetical protein [unclassified Leeuwenhoekiella]|mgnify:FL=1|uniref:hypothetical protein n=1 Tax=unclassified Leeuwenhoekiella TaxID=2615029 RepID=UPI0025C51425|nr:MULTISPECIES: hypothetical protein [unclassified Leeuwenhoekiella]